MRLAEKSPLWSWSEVINWLYKNKIIDDEEQVENALFFANINATLEERNSDNKTKEIRYQLLARISLQELRGSLAGSDTNNTRDRKDNV